MSSRQRCGILLLFLAICGTAVAVQRWSDYRRTAARPGVLYEVVRQQIEAVRDADFPRAYQQVSTGFQEKCDVTAFADLVRSDYPEITHAERVEFGRVVHDGRHAVVQVYFLLSDGDVLPCIYTLVNEDRVWKIDSAQVQKRWPSSRRLGGLRS